MSRAVLAKLIALHLALPGPAWPQLGTFLKERAEEMAGVAASDIDRAAEAPVSGPGVFFDAGSSRVRPEYRPQLERVAALLIQQPDLQLAIEGHADGSGNAALNQGLSERRARAVRDALVQWCGADASRITVRGLGATRPAATNATVHGRQMNRRVELGTAEVSFREAP